MHSSGRQSTLNNWFRKEPKKSRDVENNRGADGTGLSGTIKRRKTLQEEPVLTSSVTRSSEGNDLSAVNEENINQLSEPLVEKVGVNFDVDDGGGTILKKQRSSVAPRRPSRTIVVEVPSSQDDHDASGTSNGSLSESDSDSEAVFDHDDDDSSSGVEASDIVDESSSVVVDDAASDSSSPMPIKNANPTESSKKRKSVIQNCEMTSSSASQLSSMWINTAAHEGESQNHNDKDRHKDVVSLLNGGSSEATNSNKVKISDRLSEFASSSCAHVDEESNSQAIASCASLITVGKSAMAASSGPHIDAASSEDDIFEVASRLKRINHIQSNRYLCEYLDAYAQFRNRYSFPTWIDPSRLKDMNGNVVTDPGFDSTSIYVPSKQPAEDKGHDTPAMKQYWSIKALNFDKILLFKVGKFYEIFYQDAVIVQKYNHLKWMAHDAKPHVGFPETSLYYHAKKLVEIGFKVSVVEQMETPKELEQRNKSASAGKKEKAVRRDVCEVMSVGTCTQESMLARDNQYLCFIDAVEEEAEAQKWVIAALLVDVSSGQSFVENLQLTYDTDRAIAEALGDLATRYNMVEIYTCSAALPERLHSALGHDVELHNFKLKEPIDFMKILDQRLSTHFRASSGRIWRSEIVQRLVTQLCGYLEGSLLLEGFLGSCHINIGRVWRHRTVPADNTNREMVPMSLKSHVVEQLELDDVPHSSSDSSLLSFMDRTVTPMGRRKLREWILEPLTNHLMIEERLNVTEWTLQLLKDVNALTQNEKLVIGLHKVNDLQRRLTRLCSSGQQSQRQAVYFDNHPYKKLKHVVDFLNDINTQAIALFKHLNVAADKTSEGRLPSILYNWANDENLLNKLNEVTRSCMSCLVKESIAMTGSQVGLNVQEVYLPKEGLDKNFDSVKLKYYNLLEALDSFIGSLSNELGISMKFVHCKFKYEIEITTKNSQSASFKSAKSERGWAVTSQKAGALRVRPAEVVLLVDELDSVAQGLSDAVYPALKSIIGIINENRLSFYEIIDRLSNWDCYLSFGKTALYLDISCGLTTCKPIICHRSTPAINCKDLCHPILAAALSQRNAKFVPNHVSLGEGDARVMVLTGPNMGGKSTILRSVALMVMMAQIGCFVCASSCSITPFGNVLTRLGAKDKILEGKSTFLTELEEMSCVFKADRQPVLALVDELGRGTSTFDGTAIALSCLKKLSSDQLDCLCILSTHYHVIPDLVANGKLPNVINSHMSTVVESDRLDYGYKLCEGPCMKSLGIRIAEVAGLPQTVIDRSKEMSNKMMDQLDAMNHRYGSISN
eukprot:GHVH01005443.1.p1 GENE.GHVH01005443.1~~GHVH01005443.1.p1  ORF type:complete len:1312 (+),score=202.66 GHVH01005443.1:60-3938(+)